MRSLESRYPSGVKIAILKLVIIIIIIFIIITIIKIIICIIIIIQQDQLVSKLVQWVMQSEEPLQSYATGLLANAIEVQEIAGNLREENTSMVRWKLVCVASIISSSSYTIQWAFT